MCVLTYAHCLRALTPHAPYSYRRRPADFPAASRTTRRT